MRLQFKLLFGLFNLSYRVGSTAFNRIQFSASVKTIFIALSLAAGVIAAPVSQAAKANNVIHFATPPNTPLSAGTVGISASPDSETVVRFSSSSSSVCSVSNAVYSGGSTSATVTLLSVGTCSIDANSTGNIDFNAPPTANRQFQVLSPALIPQSINFGSIPNHVYPGSFIVSAIATSGLPVDFYSRNNSICSVVGTTVTLYSVGQCTLVANQAGDNKTYSAATPVEQSFLITPPNQSISFDTIGTKTYPGSVELRAIATSGLTVRFGVTTYSTCSVSGTTLTFVSPGTCSVYAAQPGNANWAAAPQVTQNFTILGSQSITFDSIGTQFYPGSVTLSAKATSQLGVTFAASGICTVSGATATFNGPGDCTISASQSGGGQWAAAPTVSQVFSVILRSQSIDFPVIADQSYPGSVQISANATSGQSVYFSSATSDVCTVAGNLVTLKGAGTCTILANQGGSSYYYAAPQVSRSFRVLKSQAITFATLPPLLIAGGNSATLVASASSGLQVQLSSTTPAVCSVDGATLKGLTTGTCTVLASQAGDGVTFGPAQATQSTQVKVNSASFDSSKLDMVSSLPLGGTYTAKVTVKNDGTSTWFANKDYFLGSQSAENNTIWGLKRVSVDTDVPSGGTYTFTIPVTAPATAGAYHFQWRMVQENIQWFGLPTEDRIVIVGTPTGTATVSLTASPMNSRVAPGAQANIAFTGKSTGATAVLKLELFRDIGSGFENSPVSTVTGSGAVQDFNYTYAARSGTYRFKLRSTDTAQNISESQPVIVNVTDSAIAGKIFGVRGTADGLAQAYGWVCQVASTQTLAYSVYLDAPASLGGTLLTNGTANVTTEADNLAVQSQCQTPGVGHHFVFDVSTYAAQYAGRSFYIQAQGTGSSQVVLPCDDNNCTIPSGLRIGLTTPVDGDRYLAPATVFARVAVTGGQVYDEVAININNEWIAAQADTEQNTFYAKKQDLPARADPYTVYARLRKGTSVIYSAQNKVFVDPATGITLSVSAPTAQTKVIAKTATQLAASASFPAGSPYVIASVKFYSNGQLIATAANTNNLWTSSWTPPLSATVDILARAFDGSGKVLAESSPVHIIIGGDKGPAVPGSEVPIAVDMVVPHLSNADAGTLPGNLTVGADGAASYSIPIVVPPGTAGVQPELSLNYSSSGLNGFAGLGWSLSGLSSIHRCGKTIAQDGVNDRIRFSTSDRLCLDGKRLVLANLALSDDNYWANNAEYRTEITDFSRITTNIDDKGLRSFKVETKAGEILTFGASSTSYVTPIITAVNSGTTALQPAAKSGAQSWAVDSIKDKVGNFIEIIYEQTEQGEHRPSLVRYGGNGLKAHAAVQISYESRPDAWKKYIDETRNDLRNRISHIRTYVGSDLSSTLSSATLIRDYVLSYEQSPTSGRSLLNSVQACAKLISKATDVSSTDCLPATTFAWGKPDPSKTAGFESKGIWAGGPSLSTFYNANGTTISANHPDYFSFSDFENNGYTDILEKRVRGINVPVVEANDLPQGTLRTQYRYFHNTGSAFSEYKYQLSTGEPFIVLETGDFDGDGFLDILVTTVGSGSGSAKICLSPFAKTSLGSTDTPLSFDCEGGKIYPAVGGNSARALPYVVDVLGEGRSAHYSTNISDIATVCIQGTCQVDKNPPTALAMFSPNDTSVDYSQNQYTRLNQMVDFSGVGKPYDVRWTRVNFVQSTQDGGETIYDPHYENLTPRVVLNNFNAPGAVNTGEMANYSYKSFPVPPKNTFYQPYLFDRDTDMGSISNDFNGSGYNSLAFGYLVLKWDSNNFYYSYDDAQFTICLSTGRALDCGVRQKYSKDRYVSVRAIGQFFGDGQATILADVMSYPALNKPQPSGALTMCRVTGDDTTSGTGIEDTNMACDTWAGFTMPVKGSPNAGDNIFFLDMMGTGRTQILQYHSGKFDALNKWVADDRWEVFAPIDLAPAGQALDRIYKVTNGLGATGTVEYADALTGGIVTRSTQPSLKYPMRNNPRTGKIVSRLSNANGFGAGGQISTQTSYRYEDDAANVAGRGSQGFAKVSIKDELSGIVSSSTYSQTWPFSGMALSSSVVSKDLVTLSSTVNSLKVNSISQTNGQVVYFPYVEVIATTSKDLSGDALGTKTVTNTYGDAWGNLTKQTSELDEHTYLSTTVTEYLNDPKAWLIGKPLSVTTTKTDANANSVSRKITYDYDSTTGLLNSSTQMPDIAAFKVVTTFDRTGNKFGLVNKTTQTWLNPIINPNRATASQRSRTLSSVTYDANGRFPATSTNALGQVESFTFDAGSGLRTRVDDINQLATIFTYDAFGRLKQVLTPGGTQIREYKKLCDTECPSGAALVYIVDTFHSNADGTSFSRMAVPSIQYFDNVEHLLGSLTWGLTGKKIRTSNSYDERGRVQQIGRPYFDEENAFFKQKNVYDDLNRITKLTTLDEGGKSIDFQTTFKGLQIEKQNPKNYKRVENYYPNGKLKSITDEKNGKTVFEYDAFDNLNKTTDPEGNVNTITYDVLGRKISLNDRDLGLIEYSVDPLGRTWKQTTPKQRIAKTTSSKETSALTDFDDLDRTTARYETDLESHWSYDEDLSQGGGKAAGKLTQAWTQAGSFRDYERTHLYDALGRNIQTTALAGGMIFEDLMSFDGWERPSKVTYDAMTTLEFSYRYNAKGFQYQVVRGDIVLAEKRDADAEGRDLEIRLGNGLTDVHEFYPSTGRPKYASLTTTTNNALLQQSYTFDVLGNVDNSALYWNASVSSPATGTIEKFTYDELNRVYQTTYSGEYENTYTGSGNIKTKVTPYSGKATYTYPTPGPNSVRPHAVTNITGIGDFTYDDNGNLKAGDGKNVTWTSFDMPLKISSSTFVSQFIYGPEHQRTVQCKTSKACGTYAIYYGRGQEISVQSGIFTLKTYWPWNLGFETFVDSGDSGTSKLFWNHTDRLGSIVATTGSDGTLQDSLGFDVWGKRRKFDGASAALGSNPSPDDLAGKFDNKGYTGHEMLDDLDLVHMNGRVYNPRIGRFLSADPFVPDPTNGQSYNRYSYVLNNPTNLTDPTGFCEGKVSSSDCGEKREKVVDPSIRIIWINPPEGGDRSQTGGKTGSSGEKIQSGKNDQGKVDSGSASPSSTNSGGGGSTCTTGSTSGTCSTTHNEFVQDGVPTIVAKPNGLVRDKPSTFGVTPADREVGTMIGIAASGLPFDRAAVGLYRGAQAIRAARAARALRTSEGMANSVSGMRLNAQLAAEQAAGVRAPSAITEYSEHALQQIAGRDGGIGVSQSALEDAFANPTNIKFAPSKYGPTFQFIGQDATIVVNGEGRVVTGWGTSAGGVK
ncbi:hypothetical protein GTP55_13600 [Duganella sp. FT109W]|uniref:Next to BRCA1 central domain-containing protein n=1 Tax=Duganella margarita TaxID=2692170 RepID=A0ABW9WGZ0_9BURK|nr:RHS repeat-associated core domain-containing protein [Duganella margarita]MYN40409.1 hypothetical protein [Duganella margarita]